MSPFILKLRRGARLTTEDETVLAGFEGPTHRFGRGDILIEKSEPRSIPLILEGWACRYRRLKTGRRQVTSLYLPGDLCEPFGAPSSTEHDGFGALTPVALTRVPQHAIRSAARTNVRIEEALWRDLLFSEALHREHLISVGVRSATQRLGNFFCTVHFRLELVGLAEGSSCHIPLTQPDLAEILALSPVHVSRTLRELRAEGLVSLQGRRLVIHDIGTLRELSMFDPADL